MATVTILLSTYNGEKFLKEQIDSLIAQNGVDVFILARDDGSSDSTLEILNKYKNEHSNFEFYTGGNLGPAQSFLDLVKNAPKSDFYAFCDQDDVWDNDKLICAVNKLKVFDSDKPNLYYSNLRVVDEKLNFYRLSHDRAFFNENKYSALAENLCTGCTAVFNYRAKQMIETTTIKYCSMHDTWIYMVCKLLGNTVYDSEPHISYRQHGGNVVGAVVYKGKWKLIRERVIRIFARDLQPRYNNAISFNECFRNFCNKKDIEKIDKIINYKKNIYYRFRLFIDKDISASTFYGNVRFKLHVLWGTV